MLDLRAPLLWQQLRGHTCLAATDSISVASCPPWRCTRPSVALSLSDRTLACPALCARLGREVVGLTALQALGRLIRSGPVLLRPLLLFTLCRTPPTAHSTSTHHHRRRLRLQCMQRLSRRLAAPTAALWATLVLRAASASTLGDDRRMAFGTSRSSTHAPSCTALTYRPLAATSVPTARRYVWRLMRMLTSVACARQRRETRSCHRFSIPPLTLQDFPTLCRCLRPRGQRSAA